MEKITFNFKNRTALVTGGAQGFGLDIAKRFLKSGAKVIIWDIDPNMLKRATNEINSPNLSSNIIDVSKYKDVESCINDITKKSNILPGRKYVGVPCRDIGQNQVGLNRSNISKEHIIQEVSRFKKLKTQMEKTLEFIKK